MTDAVAAMTGLVPVVVTAKVVTDISSTIPQQKKWKIMKKKRQ
jgi:hypothetical protein